MELYTRYCINLLPWPNVLYFVKYASTYITPFSHAKKSFKKLYSEKNQTINMYYEENILCIYVHQVCRLNYCELTITESPLIAP